ncbi:MAG: phosphoribosylformylglycinamidine cyclo-ligase [Cyanobacteria bacterium P01_A01_bin.45]
MNYQDAGVDVEAGRAFVGQIKDLVRSTYRSEVIGGYGGFGGCFQLPVGYQEPVLVSGTDGVGTKLKIANVLNIHNTVGVDLVAMCVNDVLTCGAEPMFFLDYLATGKLNQEQLKNVVSGVVAGCKISGCALLGGETAEMPGFYQADEYDLAGFCVGIVEKSQMLDTSQVKVGDSAIALASSGIHSNGLSLVRKIISDNQFSWSDRPKLLAERTLGEVFLTPTRIYVKPILEARKNGLEIRGMAHITGGGLPENLPRCLREDLGIEIYASSWQIPSEFKWLAEAGSLDDEAMYNTFNMGIGFVILVPPQQADSAIKYFTDRDILACKIGQVIEGSQEVVGLFK